MFLPQTKFCDEAARRVGDSGIQVDRDDTKSKQTEKLKPQEIIQYLKIHYSTKY